MKQKRTKNKKGILNPQMIGVIAVIVILAFAFGFFNTGSIIKVGGFDYQENKTLNFNGGSVLATSDKFGTTTSGDYLPLIDGRTGTAKSEICGDNDGNIQFISEIISSSNGFNSQGILTSSQNCGTITQTGKITFTENGLVSAKCKIFTLPDSDRGYNLGRCTIGGNTLRLTGKNDLGSANQEKNFQFEVSKGQVINYDLFNSVESGRTDSTLIFSFEPNQVIEEETETQTGTSDPQIPGQTQPTQTQNKTLWGSIVDFFKGILNWFKK